MIKEVGIEGVGVIVEKYTYTVVITSGSSLGVGSGGERICETPSGASP